MKQQFEESRFIQLCLFKSMFLLVLQMDILEHPHVKNGVVLQTVLEEVCMQDFLC